MILKCLRRLLLAGLGLLVATSTASAQGRLYGSEAFALVDDQGGTRLLGIVPGNRYLQSDLKITDSQRKRMREILLQLAKPSTIFARKSVVATLRITGEQKKQARALEAEHRKKHRDLMLAYIRKRSGNEKPDSKALERRVKVLRQNTERSLFKLLSREQRDRFRKLIGKPIDRKQLLTPIYRSGQSVLLGQLADNKALQRELSITASQRKRMRQIELQLIDPTKLLWQADVFETVRITKKQREEQQKFSRLAIQQTESLIADYRKEKAENEQTDFATFQKQIDKANATRDASILKLLTREQRRRLNRLTGPPLDLKRLRRNTPCPDVSPKLLNGSLFERTSLWRDRWPRL